MHEERERELHSVNVGTILSISFLLAFRPGYINCDINGYC
jgi:hypothetical protein